MRSQREKRQLEEKLRRTRKLGEALDEEEDDLAAWVAKSRVDEDKVRRERDERAAKEAALAAAKEARRKVGRCCAWRTRGRTHTHPHREGCLRFFDVEALHGGV